MDAHEVVARYMFEHLGVLSAHDNRPFSLYEEAEFSPIGSEQDAYFRSQRMASDLLDSLRNHGYVFSRKSLEPIE